MASMIRVVSGLSPKSLCFREVLRPLSISAASNSNASGGEGWFSKLLHVRKIEPTKDSHSKLLSDAERIYELQIHDVKPDSIQPYLQEYKLWVQTLCEKSKTAELVGSWRVEIGNQDQFLHIWRYNKGYPSAMEALELHSSDADLVQIHKNIVNCIVTRCNQFMLPFSFWGHPEPKERNSMYEIRSYVLKPGTMIEWGNNWARGINYRRSTAVAGFFSQIGQLYMVHHIWTYENLQKRKEIREAAWRKPGWDECVAYTVPLIREMRSRWLRPLPFSPIK